MKKNNVPDISTHKSLKYKGDSISSHLNSSVIDNRRKKHVHGFGQKGEIVWLAGYTEKCYLDFGTTRHSIFFFLRLEYHKLEYSILLFTSLFLEFIFWQELIETLAVFYCVHILFTQF